MTKLYTDSNGYTVVDDNVYPPGRLYLDFSESDTKVTVFKTDSNTPALTTILITNLTDSGGTPYADKAALLTALGSAFFNPVSSQNPVWSRYTDSDELVSASDIGATDNTWKDQGAEIDCRGYKNVSIFVDLTVNDSTGNQLQVLCKHESAGSQEYVLETSADYQKIIGDSDTQIVYTFNTESIPYIQVQTKATDVDTGGGTIGTVIIDIIKSY